MTSEEKADTPSHGAGRYSITVSSQVNWGGEGQRLVTTHKFLFPEARDLFEETAKRWGLKVEEKRDE